MQVIKALREIPDKKGTNYFSISLVEEAAATASNVAEIQAAEPKEAAKALPDDLLHQVVVLGSKKECLERLRQIRNLGVEPLVVPVGTGNPIYKILNELDPSY
jgi:hypothetical protein